MLDYILLLILIAAGILEFILIATGHWTITRELGTTFKLPRWANLTIMIGLAVFQYFLYIEWGIEIHPLLVAIYNLIFGHFFGRF